MGRVWEIELYRNGKRQADITPLATNRKIVLRRNDAGQITFDIDLTAFSKYCIDNGLNARYILWPYQTDIVVKMDGLERYGFHVVGTPFELSADGERMTVVGTGFLNLLADRYLTISYEGQERTAIATDLIEQAQAQENGSVGITIADEIYETGITDTERTYERKNVKLALQQLAELSDGRFDFEVTWDKEFRIVESLGAVRSDLRLVYGGAGSNISGFRLARMAAGSLYNRIIGLASGFGADGIISVQDDDASQKNYYLREKILQWNSVKEQETLDRNAQTQLDLRKELADIPDITFPGKELDGKPFISVGDRLPVKVSGHPSLDNIDGIYRVEEITIDIDDNDFETISVKFDDYGLGEEVFE